MKEDRQEKQKLSNDLLDAMLVGVKTQEDLWGKEGIITQINKALLERILNAEMDFHLDSTEAGRSAGNRLRQENSQEQLRHPRTVHSKRQT